MWPQIGLSSDALRPQTHRATREATVVRPIQGESQLSWRFRGNRARWPEVRPNSMAKGYTGDADCLAGDARHNHRHCGCGAFFGALVLRGRVNGAHCDRHWLWMRRANGVRTLVVLLKQRRQFA